MKPATRLTTTPAILSSLNRKELAKPLFVLTKKDFTPIKVMEDIKSIEIYAGNRVIVVHENNDRQEVLSQHLSIPQLPTEEAYQDYFKQTFLEVKQLDNGKYAINIRVRGLGGGCGNGKQEEAIDDGQGGDEEKASQFTKEEEEMIEEFISYDSKIKIKDLDVYVENQKDELLVSAVKSRNVKMVSLLLRAGANPNQKDNKKHLLDFEKDSLLILATDDSECQSSEIALLLIEAGADVNVESGRLRVPVLYLAIQNKFSDVVTALIKAGADVNATYFDYSRSEKYFGTLLYYRTVLHLAVAQKSFDYASQLIEAGADVNASDDLGNTVFYDLCYKGYLQLILKVIPQVKDIDCENKHGSTALSVACSKGHQDVVKLLLDKGADPKKIPKEVYEKFSTSIKELLNADFKKANSALFEKVAEQIARKILRSIAKEKNMSKELLNSVRLLLTNLLANSNIIQQVYDEEDPPAVLARQSLAEHVKKELVDLLNNPLIFDAKTNTLDEDEFKSAIDDTFSTWRAEKKQQLLEEEKSKKIREEKLKTEKQEQMEEKRKTEKREQEELELKKKELRLKEEELKTKNSPMPNPSSYFQPVSPPPTSTYIPPPPVNPVNQFQTNMQLATDLMNATANLEQGTAALIDAFKP